MRAAIVLVAVLASVAADGGTYCRLFKCNATSATQQWQRGPTGNEIVQTNGGACLDVESYGVSDGSVVWAYSPCHPDDHDPSHQNEAWQMNANGTITEIMTGKCLDTVHSTAFSQSPIVIKECSGVPTQQWTYDSATKLIRSGVAGYCLDIGTTRDPYIDPCSLEPGKSMPFCDTSLSLDDRIANLIGNLTLDEKLGLFANGADAVPRLNIWEYQWWSEALHGVAFSPGVEFTGNITAATSFPQVITTAASFHPALYHAVGQAIGTEGRAMNNQGQAGLTFWAPNINIIRDPRWGRGQETPGEDPFLTSTYVKNYVSGMQGNDTKYLKVSSCCKHYFAYDLENWGGVTRDYFDAIVSAQDETETYLPAFQSCVQEGRSSGIMCSYNSVNGVPSCAHKDTMTTFAREQWGFEGYITSDCGAVSDVYNTHHYTNSTDETCAITLSAGMDIDCGSFLDSFMGQAIQDGVLDMSVVDTALQHLFAVQFRLGMFDPDAMQPYTNIPPSAVNSPAHQQLALDAARQGMVLLKNNNSVLPLSNNTIKTVAIVGPNADATSVLQGNYYGQAPYLISPEQGLGMYAKTLYVQGCDVSCANTNGFQDASLAAHKADATIIVVGIDQDVESEGHDRTEITLPGLQNQFITEVAGNSSGPVIVVVMGGGPLDISVPKSLSSVDAIIWCGYPGQSGGQAIADIIFGTYAPAGRLPYTMYPGEYVNQVSMFDMEMRPNTTSGSPGHTYRFYTGTPVYSFGTGLSYSKFNVTLSGGGRVALSTVSSSLAMVATVPLHEQAPLSTITATITNVGSVTSDFAALLFQNGLEPVKADGSGLDAMLSLVGFDRVMQLAPGASAQVQFPIDARGLSRVLKSGERVGVRGEWVFSCEGASVVVEVY